MTIPKSKKGFLAIDIDGTALVQKIDKNPIYGLRNSQSNVRLALISYIQKAQAEGYDIIILTARPKPVEGLLGMFKIGTKPTQDIVNILKEYGVTVESVERAPTGLKGAKMKQILDKYPPDAEGMLFDDQLKQINDVKQLKNQKLTAYDINSKKDLMKYATKMGFSKDNFFHPDNIREYVLGQNQSIKKLHQSLEEFAKKAPNSPEVFLVQAIIDELCIRLLEAYDRDYEPEVEWVKNATKNMQLFVDKLAKNETISIKDLIKARNEIFHKSKLDEVLPNSNCDDVIKYFLQECAQGALINALKKQCDAYQQTNAGTLTIEQHDLLNNLSSKLDIPDKAKALKEFSDLFLVTKDELKLAPNAGCFIETIRSILAKIPLMGQLFKTAQEKDTEDIEECITTISKTKWATTTYDLTELEVNSDSDFGIKMSR